MSGCQRKGSRRRWSARKDASVDLRLKSEELPEQLPGELRMGCNLGPFNGDAVALVVQLVPQTVIPLNLAGIDIAELVGCVLLQRIQKSRKALADLFVFALLQAQTGNRCGRAR